MSRSRNRRNRSKKSKSTLNPHYPNIQRGKDSEDALEHMFEFWMQDCFCERVPVKPHRHRRRLQITNKRFNYSSYACDEFEASGSCSRGKECVWSHGTFEKIYHPMCYKTDLCEYEECSRGAHCSYAHSQSELRDLSAIFGVNWRSYNDAEAIEYEAEQQRAKKRAKQRSPAKMRVASEVKPPVDSWIQGDSWDEDDVYSRSYCVRETGSREGEIAQEEPDTPSRLRVIAEASPAPEVEMKENDSTAKADVQSPNDLFAEWFTQEYRGEKWQRVLQQFQDNDLDSLEFLWLMVRTDKAAFTKDILIDFLGLNSLQCKGFHTKLKKRMHLTDVREWLKDVVGLPQYVEIFDEYGFGMETLTEDGMNVDEVLRQMGITSFGHRRRIDFHLEEWKRISMF